MNTGLAHIERLTILAFSSLERSNSGSSGFWRRLFLRTRRIITRIESRATRISKFDMIPCPSPLWGLVEAL